MINISETYRNEVQAIRYAVSEYLSPEETSDLYLDIPEATMRAILKAAGVSPESEWSEDFLAAHVNSKVNLICAYFGW